MTDVVPLGHAAALLELSRTLAQNQDAGVLGETLRVVLAGAGLKRGAAYQASGDELELVASEGLPIDLREQIARLPLSGSLWFVAQRAARRRGIVVESDVSSTTWGRLSRDVLARAGYVAALAAPLVYRRTTFGVILLAAPSPEVFDDEARLFAEAASNFVAAILGRASDARGPAVPDKEAQGAALAALAATYSSAIAPAHALARTHLLETQRLMAGFDELARAALPELDSVVRRLAAAMAAIDEAERTTAALATPREPAGLEPVDVAICAMDALASVAADLDRNQVRADRGLQPGCMVAGRTAELVAALVALVKNAAEACQRTLGRSPSSDVPSLCRRILVGVRREAGSVVVEVGDSGPGISPDVRPRMFEPSFTTKPGSHGLGLTLVRQTAAAHGGHVEVGSSHLGGALLRIVLPALAGARVDSAPRKSTLRPRLARQDALFQAPPEASLGAVRHLPPASFAVSDARNAPTQPSVPAPRPRTETQPPHRGPDPKTGA